MKWFILIGLCALTTGWAKTTEEFAIGKPCPDIQLLNVKGGLTPNVRVADLKGKPVILYFWSLGCVGAVTGLPEINEIQKQFENQIQIIAIGKEDEATKRTFRKYQKHYQFDFAYTFDNSLFDRFSIRAYPFTVMVDKNSEVAGAMTKVIKEEVQTFLRGGSVISLTNWMDLDFKKPLFVEDTTFLFRSILKQWAPELGFRWYDFQKSEQLKHTHWSNKRSDGIQIVGADINFLYRIAYAGSSYFRPEDDYYYGKIWPLPLMEKLDSLQYVPNHKTGENYFCYSLIVPKEMANDEMLQKRMQRDLKDYFGFNVSYEKRLMPYWKMVASEKNKSKLKTSGGETVYPKSSAGESAGANLINIPVRTLIAKIWGYHQDELPIIDETGIIGNIDVKLDAIMTDFQDIKRGLENVGIELVKSEKEMWVIVLKDELH